MMPVTFRYAAAILIAFAAIAADAQPPTISQLQAEWGNLHGRWRFRIDPDRVGEDNGWQSIGFDDSSWQDIQVPGLWEPQGVTQQPDGEPAPATGGVQWTSYDGAAWYRLHFTVPASWRGEDLVLLLGKADDYDRTFINGTLVGETGTDVERAVTIRRRYAVPPEVIRFGDENVLAVRVIDGGGPGGMIGPLVSLLPRAALEELMTLPQDDRPLKQRFNDPPASCRILKIVHGLPDSESGQDDLIRELIHQGFGGMATNVSFDGYVESEEKWEAFVSGVNKARQAGMALWLYDELGYPSGTAGGIVLRGHPEWQARGLFVAETDTTGDGVQLDIPPGDIKLAQAFPIGEAGIALDDARDLADRITDDALSWDPPDGHWRVMVITEGTLFEGTHAAVSLHDNKPYINLLIPEPTERFLEVTHGEYARRLGDDLGEYFRATFTDEPSLMSMFFKRQPYSVLPWSQSFAGQFESRRGYDLEPLLPLLAASGDGAKRVRYDFWLTVAELVSESYFGEIRDWCRGHNIPSGGHLLLEEPLTTHVCLYGDLMRCTRYLDAPSIDCLTSIPDQVPWRVARMASSAAELNGTDLTMSETSDHSQHYRPAGDDRPVQIVTEAQIRGTCNRLMLNGINTITSYYSFADLSNEQLRRLNNWVGRCCTMLRGGHQVTDIAVLYPIHSVWPEFVPARRWATDARAANEIQGVFEQVCESLFRNRRDFTFIDAETIAGARIEDGSLIHGDLSWRVIVLPAADTLPMDAWRKLEQFYEAGGAIISVAALPENSETDFPSQQVREFAGEAFGSGGGLRAQSNASGGAAIFLPRGAVALLPHVLDRTIAPDVHSDEPDSPIRATHRHIDDAEVYFLINDSNEPRRETVSVAAEGQGELWDPSSGGVTPLPGGDAVQLELEPYGGVFLRYPMASDRPRRDFDEAGMPGISLRPLRDIKPDVGKGEFVDAQLEETRMDEGRAWRADASLTKGDVDTFLFLSFPYPEPVDLTDAWGLVLVTDVPQDQETPAEMLVIVSDDTGGEYLANTGRSLAAGGRQETYLSISSFHSAPWGDDSNGKLDLDAITRIAVGWGGYYGTEGEGISFSLRAPQAVIVGD